MKSKMLMGLILVSMLVVFSTVAGAWDAPYDFGGETVTYALSIDLFEDPEDQAYLEEVEEKFNANIEIIEIPWNEVADTLRTSVLAGDKPADVIRIQSHWMLQWDLYQFLMPLNYLVQPEFFDRYPDVGIKNSYEQFPTIGGNIYQLPRSGPALVVNTLFNKDLFEELGLPSLYEVAEAKQWTWEALKEIAVMATRDTNGDGEINQYGLHGHHVVTDIARTNNAKLVKNVDGKLVFDGTDPAFIEALEFVRELGDLGVTGPLQGSDGERLGNWFDGNLAMLFYQGNYWPMNWKEPDFEVGILPLPMGPRADDYVGLGNAYANSYVVPVTVENATAKIEMLLALNKLAEPYVAKEDIVDWEELAISRNFHDRETLEWEKYMQQRIDMDFSDHMLPQSVKDTLWNAAMGDGSVSPSSAMESVADEAQTYLDENFNN